MALSKTEDREINRDKEGCDSRAFFKHALEKEVISENYELRTGQDYERNNTEGKVEIDDRTGYLTENTWKI